MYVCTNNRYMKPRHLFTAILLLSLSTVAHAQFEAGIKGGFSGNWLTGTAMKGGESTKVHSGYYGGLFADYILSDRFFLQGEVLYNTKGHADNSKYEGHYRRDLKYINIPVYFAASFWENLHVMAGPEFGFLVGCKIHNEGSESIDGMDDCKKLDMGIAIQLEYLFAERFGINLKGNYSFTKVFDVPYQADPFVAPVQDDGRNIGFQVGICYKFVVD